MLISVIRRTRGVENDEVYDIIIPYLMVRKYLIKIIMRNKRCSRDNALFEIDKQGQMNLEQRYLKDIKRHFKCFIQNEVRDWENYENRIKKGW